jgi:hypothetical protein
MTDATADSSNQTASDAACPDGVDWQPRSPTLLPKYEAACKAVDAAHAVDEAKDISDQEAARAAYVRQAGNGELIFQVTEMRLRGERGLGQLMAEGGKAAAGMGKTAMARAHKAGAMSENEYDGMVADIHARVMKAIKCTKPSKRDLLRARKTKEAVVVRAIGSVFVPILERLLNYFARHDDQDPKGLGTVLAQQDQSRPAINTALRAFSLDTLCRFRDFLNEVIAAWEAANASSS